MGRKLKRRTPGPTKDIEGLRRTFGIESPKGHDYNGPIVERDEHLSLTPEPSRPSPLTIRVNSRPVAPANAPLPIPAQKETAPFNRGSRHVHYLGRRALDMEGITENWLVKLSTMGLDAMKIIGDPGLRYLTKGDIRRSIPRVEGSNSALRDPAKSIAKARDFLLAVMNDGKFDNINAGRQTRHRVNNVYVSSSIPSRTEDGRRVSDDSVRARIFGLHVRSGKGALDDQVVFGEFDYLSRYRGSEPAPQSLGQRFFYVPLVKVVDRFDGPDAIDLLRGIAKGLMPDLPRMVVLEEVGLILQESHAEGPHSPTAGE